MNYPWLRAVGYDGVQGVAIKSLSLQANKLRFVASQAVAWLGHAISWAIHRASATISTYKMKERFEQLATSILEKVFTFATLAPGRIAAARDALVARARGRRLQAIEAPQIVEPSRLTMEAHWDRVSSVISGAIGRFREIESLQAAATRQIDAADYALQHLWRDLAFAMPVPADGSELRALLDEVARTTTPPREAAVTVPEKKAVSAKKALAA